MAIKYSVDTKQDIEVRTEGEELVIYLGQDYSWQFDEECPCVFCTNRKEAAKNENYR